MPTSAANDPGIRNRIIELRLDRLAGSLGRAPKTSGSPSEHCDFCPMEVGESCNLGCSAQFEKWKQRL
jgi:hypothetical protein